MLSDVFLLKRNVKYFSSIFILHNKVCLWSDTVDYRWNYFFVSVTSTSYVAAWIFTSRRSNMQKIDTLTLPLSDLKSLNFHFQWDRCQVSSDFSYGVKLLILTLNFGIDKNNCFTKIPFLVTDKSSIRNAY